MLTKFENSVMEATGCFMNYDEAEYEKEDNAVVFTLVELSAKSGLKVATLKGVVGSLFKKGLLCEMEYGDMHQNMGIGITDAGIDAHYELYEMMKAGTAGLAEEEM